MLAGAKKREEAASAKAEESSQRQGINASFFSCLTIKWQTWIDHQFFSAIPVPPRGRHNNCNCQNSQYLSSENVVVSQHAPEFRRA